MIQRSVHVGRQPIFTLENEVVGYELLFRAGPDADMAEFTDADAATTQTIVTTFSQFGMRSLVGSGSAFINVTRPFLTGVLPLPFESDLVVLEILTDIEPDAEVLEGCRRLAQEGFRLAVDSLVPNDPRLVLLEHMSYAKVDAAHCRMDTARDLAASCRDHSVMLIAQKVETEADLEAGWVLGCTLFQGRHLAQAQVVGTQVLSPARLGCLRLLGRLSDPNVSFEDVEELVRTEPALAVRVLTVANSAAAGARREISSVRHALVLLGLNQLRGWLQLMLLSDLADTASELFAQALIRARACEVLAANRTDVRADTAFTTGLVSCLDLLLGEPIEWIAARMGLGNDLHFALTAGTGPLGELLEAVRLYEQQADLARYGNTDPAEMTQAFLEGMQWSQRSRLAAATSIQECEGK